MRTWFNQFPEFELDVEIPEGWEDISWGNDVCPSWHPMAGVRVWVDYKNPERREFPDGERFHVILEDEEGQFTRNVVSTNEWPVVLYIVRQLQSYYLFSPGELRDRIELLEEKLNHEFEGNRYNCNKCGLWKIDPVHRRKDAEAAPGVVTADGDV
jgi:hypothetical protein